MTFVKMTPPVRVRLLLELNKVMLNTMFFLQTAHITPALSYSQDISS